VSRERLSLHQWSGWSWNSGKARWRTGSPGPAVDAGPDFAKENAAWLRLYRLPAHAPDLNPAEGI
jgi:hypothetical protein